MSDPYQCDDCEETFDRELLGYFHAKNTDHTVRYWGDNPEEAKREHTDE